MELRVAARRQKLAAFEAALIGMDEMSLSMCHSIWHAAASAVRLAWKRRDGSGARILSAGRDDVPYGPAVLRKLCCIGWGGLCALLTSRAAWTVLLAHIAAKDKALVGSCVKEWLDVALRARFRARCWLCEGLVPQKHGASSHETLRRSHPRALSGRAVRPEEFTDLTRYQEGVDRRWFELVNGGYVSSIALCHFSASLKFNLPSLAFCEFQSGCCSCIGC